MKHLFLIDPIEDFHPQKDTTLAFMRSVTERGGEVWAAQMQYLSGRAGKASVHATRYRIDVSQTPFFTAEETIHTELEFFHVVWMRKDPPFDQQYINATRSEERRVGKESRPRWTPAHSKKNRITDTCHKVRLL